MLAWGLIPLALAGCGGEGAKDLRLETKGGTLTADLRMPSPQLAETVAWVRAHCPETTVLVLTAHDRDDYLARMVAAGVAGFVVKEQALWQPLLVRRITFAVNGTCVQGERQSPEGALIFHDADTRR